MNFTFNKKNPFASGGWNKTHYPEGLMDASVRALPRPNNDTLYVLSLLDLRKDPVVIHYPAFSSRFVSLETSAMDHYVEIPLATSKGDFKKPTTFLYYSARTEGYKAEPVQGVDKIMEMSGDFVVAFLRVMPEATDPVKFKANMAALRPLGVKPGKIYHASQHGEIDGGQLGKAFGEIAKKQLAIWIDPKKSASFLTKLFQPKGHMEIDEMVLQSVVGPIGQPADQAMYPGVATTDGKPMNAQHDYVIRMTKDELPPAIAFWSLTLYDAKEGFFIPNKEKKYSVGENAGMKLNASGGIEIYVAAKQPKGVPAENWLPITREDLDLNIIMRVYQPELEKMQTWKAPKAEILKK